MTTWHYDGFKLDDGREAVVEWSWDETEGATVVEAWIEATLAFGLVYLTDAELERFNEQVISLRPFPPHEYDHSIDLEE